MYPNFNAEFARKGFTLEKLSEEMEKRGKKRTVATLSLKLNGKAPLTVDEAKLMRDIVAPGMSISIFDDVEVI